MADVSFDFCYRLIMLVLKKKEHIFGLPYIKWLSQSNWTVQDTKAKTEPKYNEGKIISRYECVIISSEEYLDNDHFEYWRGATRAAA